VRQFPIRVSVCLLVMLRQETWSFPNAPYRRDHVVMKILTQVSRFLLGLIFLIFGLNGFLHFIPMPPPSGLAGQFLGAMFVSKYLLVVSGLQVISGALLLINRYIPLALTILGPIIVNILLFHALMSPVGIGLAVFVTIFWGVVFVSVRSAFAGIFEARVEIKAEAAQRHTHLTPATY
jgi:putative oxidoreductase